MNNEHIELKFKLGSQLENWEFDLSTIREYIENEICYEIYEYVGSDKSFLGFEADRIELSFNADILEKVEYYFMEEQHIELLGELEYRLGKPAEGNTLLTSWCDLNYYFTIEKLSSFKIIRVSYKLTQHTKG